MGLAMISCAKREEERWKTLDSYAKTFGQSIECGGGIGLKVVLDDVVGPEVTRPGKAGEGIAGGDRGGIGCRMGLHPLP